MIIPACASLAVLPAVEKHRSHSCRSGRTSWPGCKTLGQIGAAFYSFPSICGSQLSFHRGAMAGERCAVSARSHGAQGSQREASRKGLVSRCVQQVKSGTVKGARLTMHIHRAERSLGRTIYVAPWHLL